MLFSWLSVGRVRMECVEMLGQQNMKCLTTFARSQTMQHRTVTSSCLLHNELLKVWSKALVACWWVGAVTCLTEGQLRKASVGRGSPGGCPEADASLTRSDGDVYWLTSQLNFLKLTFVIRNSGNIVTHKSCPSSRTTKSSFLYLSFFSQMRPIPLRFFLILSLYLTL